MRVDGTHGRLSKTALSKAPRESLAAYPAQSALSFDGTYLNYGRWVREMRHGAPHERRPASVWP